MSHVEPSTLLFHEDAKRFRARARQFSWITGAGLFIVAGFIALTILVMMTRARALGEDTVWRLALIWSPVLFYAGALFEARRLFACLARAGIAFGPSIARSLARIGLFLCIGGVIGLVAGFVVLVARPPGAGGFAFLGAPALTIAIVGLALFAIARLIGEADAIRRRNARLEAELEDFF